MKIFLSYRTSNQGDIADLASKLQVDGHQVWWDRVRMGPGADLLAEISKGLEQAEVVVACFGHEGMGDFQRIEIGATLYKVARNRGARLVCALVGEGQESSIPFLLRGFLFYRAATPTERQALVDGIRSIPDPTMAAPLPRALVWSLLSRPYAGFAVGLGFAAGVFALGRLTLWTYDLLFPPTPTFVELKELGFALTRTEVTVAEYQACSDRGICRPMSSGDSCDRPVDHPVGCVRWEDTVVFCRDWLGGARLPTVEEWQGAASVNGTYRFPPMDLARYAHHIRYLGKAPSTHPVGTTIPDTLGLYDLYGNVWEWTSTCFSGEPPCDRAMVGGSADSIPGDLAPTNREYRLGNAPAPFVGFRCARDH